jgi:VCBS repeat-containing protein
LDANDVDNTANELIYQLTSAPSNGTLTRNGVTLGLNDTFTQADLDSGLVSYNHDGSETTTDSFDFTLSDGNITLSAETFNITVNPVNDAPIISNGTMTVAEDGSQTIDLNTLITDAEGINTATDITISVPANGTAIYDGTTGIVTYTSNANYFGADSFTYTVDDGTGPQTGTINVTVTPVNDDAVIAINTGTTVAEAGSVVIINTMLQGADVDNPLSDLTYEITNLANGHIEVGGVIQNTFTTADLDGGQVVFIHDGSETTTAQFDVRVRDVIGTPSAYSTFSMTAIPTNDAPFAIAFSNIIVGERETSGYIIGTLSTSDVDLPGDIFTYSITSDPDGKFAIINNQLVLDSTLSFITAESHSVTVQTDDGNGGIFEQEFTIEVERADDGVNVLPDAPDFGESSGRLLEEDRIIDSQSQSSLLDNLLNNNALSNAFYGSDGLPQILRQAMQSITPTINQDGSFGFSFNNDTNTEEAIENTNEQLIDDNSTNFTRLVDFLKMTENFNGEELSQENVMNETTDTDDGTIVTFLNIQDQFDNVLTYHQQRAQSLLDALKGNSDI